MARLTVIRQAVESSICRLELTDSAGEPIDSIDEIANCYGMAWSPDGNRLAFSEGSLVHVLPAAGGERTTLFAGPGGPYPGGAFNLEWLRDGARLRFDVVDHVSNPDLANPRQVTLDLARAPGR